MIKKIVFNGGLGNQMFQYAFYLRMRHESPLSFFIFDTEQSRGCHNGFELDKVFHIDCGWKTKYYRKVNKYSQRMIGPFNEIVQKNSLEYDPSLMKEHHVLSSYTGYWQSEEYFKPVEKSVRKAFTFREELLSEKTIETSAYLRSINSVSVHIRRGDYLRDPDYYGLCTTDYYNKSISLLKERIPNALFVFISDDVDWARQSIKCENAFYVDWNNGKNSWQDMYLMSCCKHNIVANSSFSWWGAWLNPNPEKTVVTPKPWFDYSSDYDIVPSNWQRIER